MTKNPIFYILPWLIPVQVFYRLGAATVFVRFLIFYEGVMGEPREFSGENQFTGGTSRLRVPNRHNRGFQPNGNGMQQTAPAYCFVLLASLFLAAPPAAAGPVHFGKERLISPGTVRIATGLWSGTVSSGGQVSFTVAGDCETINNLAFDGIGCGSGLLDFRVSSVPLASIFSFSDPSSCPPFSGHGSFGPTDSNGSLFVFFSGSSPVSCTRSLNWTTVPPPAPVSETCTQSTATDGAVDVYTADLDRDGELDILSASVLDDKIAWYENLDDSNEFGSQQVISVTADG
ncbi:MAG: hypothetical protein L0Y39_08560, partial [Methylococcaceae bacterium]|nr:hypothetical protein [Methylococcaceae bacterium]